VKNISTLLGYSLAFMLPAFVEAANFNVAAGDVYGPQGLVAAINAANQNGGKNTINLEPGIYTLNVVDNDTDGPNGLPSVQSNLTISGAGADVTVIERLLGAPSFRLIHIAASGSLDLTGLALQRGGNFVTMGGALFNRGKLMLDDTILQGNSNVFGPQGLGGRGGGLFNVGEARLENCLISGNSAGQGGGIYNETEGQLTISSCSIENNVAGDAGGGIINDGTLTLTRSTVSSNDAERFGGLDNRGVAIITSSTFARNAATFIGGGGIDNVGFLTLTNSTVAHNESISLAGAGLTNSGMGILTIQNSIIANNIGFFPPQNENCSGPIISLGHNLFDPSGCTGLSSSVTDLIADPGLGAFIDDAPPGGGHFPLLPGSVAINAGDDTACPVRDQLGLPRSGTCDIGSVEFQGSRVLVSVDVRPRSDANKINPNSTKNINVAIISANGFDATTVEPNTVRFGATGAEAAPVQIAIRDVDGDGDQDMVLRFQIPDTGITCGDISAVLTAQTSNGLSIIGSSPINTVQCKQPMVSGT
jgi:hypothetical protein